MFAVTFAGGQPLEKLTWELERQTQITAADTLFVLNEQKSRMLQRTGLGRDIDGRPFAGYSTRGPYYYYPYKAERQAKLDLRFSLGASQLNLFTSNKVNEINFSNFQRGRLNARLTRFAKKTGGVRTRTGIKYASYAAFKGGSVVDLMGPSAPHMLQAMVVQARGPNEGVIGIYDDEASRATGHNTGVPSRHLPQREFFGWGAKDRDEVVSSLERLVGQRIKQI